MRDLMFRCFGWLLLCGCLVAAAGGATADEFDDLRIKWRDLLTGGTNLPLADPVVQSRISGIASTANSYWSSLNKAPGRTNLWSDAARPNQSEDITTCFNRLRSMALAWATRGCSLQSNSLLAADIISGLDWMYANHYNEGVTNKYDNWWDWEIGSPQHLNNAAVLMYDLLTPVQLTNYNRAVDRFTPSPKDTGANRTDTGLVVGIRGILGRNSAKVGSCRDGLSPVFPYVTSGDGFYTDGSFIQHGKHPYTGSYGSVLIDGLGKLMWLLAGSPWEVTDSGRANVFRWVYDSYEPVIYKGATMDNLRGRAISRSGSTDHAAGAGNMASILQIAQFAPSADALAFKRMLKYWILADTFRNFTNNVALHLLEPTRALMADTNVTPREQLIGHYQFPNMDRVVHLRPGFGFAVSMSSSPIYTYECINTENLHGWFTGDGMTTLYNSDLGQFSGNYWATIDPYHLPGTTVDLTARSDGSGQSATTGQNWVGGASLGEFGLAGMSLDAQASSLVGRKSWFMFDDEVVCLGSGITCGSASPVHTTVENRKLSAAGTNELRVNGVGMPAGLGWSSNLTGVGSCWLAGAGGYFLPESSAVSVVRESRTNTWYAVNKLTTSSSATNPVSDPYLTFWFDHGVKPTNAAYAYVALPNLSAAETMAYAAAPQVAILSNTTNIQAVRETTLGITAANFWNSGTNGIDFITVNGKASVLVKEADQRIELAVSDPTQTNTGSLMVTLDRAATWFVSGDAGVTVQQLAPKIRVSVAVNGARGRSFRVKLSTDPRNPNPTWDANPSAAGAQDGPGTWSGSAVNWWDGVGNVVWNDAGAPMATFGSGGTADVVDVEGPHAASSLVFAPVAAGAYTLSGGGPLTLQNGLTANASATIDVPLSMPAAQLWTIDAGKTLTLAKPAAASAPLDLTLAGDGELRFAGGASQLSGALGQVSVAGNLTLEIAGHTETIPQLSLDNGVKARVRGTGTLAVNGNGDLRLGGTVTGATEELDLSGLAAFTYKAADKTFSVGGQANTVQGIGEVRFATNTAIAVRTFAVQNVTGSTSAQSKGSLYLGQSTILHADYGSIGLVRDNGSVQFSPGAINPVLVIRGTDGLSPAVEWTIGGRGSSYFGACTGLVDLVSGVAGSSTLDARMGTLKLANEGYCLSTTASVNGSMAIGAGVLEVTNLILGLKSSVSTQSLGVVNATFSQAAGSLVLVDNVVFGDTVPGNTGTVNATYHLSGGALRAHNIQPGSGAANRSFTWAQGVLGNRPGGDLTITLPSLTITSAGTHEFDLEEGRMATVSSTIVGTGGIVKTGPGWLLLSGNSTYGGATTVSQGALRVDGALGGTGEVIVAAGATLRGSGVINGRVRVYPGGTFGPDLRNGAMTFGSDLLFSGDLRLELARSLAPSNGVMLVSGMLTNGGTGKVSVVNLGAGAWAAGDRFVLFNRPMLNGAALRLGAGDGVIWTNRLAVDGSIEVLRVTSTVPPTLSVAVTGQELTLSWPADHTGWRLEAQTNSLAQGLGAAWFPWPGSEGTNSVIIPMLPENPAVFFRLMLP